MDFFKALLFATLRPMPTYKVMRKKKILIAGHLMKVWQNRHVDL